MVKRVSYECFLESQGCSEPAAIRVAVQRLPAAQTLALGTQETPPTAEQGLDLCAEHVRFLRVEDGNLVLVFEEAPKPNPEPLALPFAEGVPA